MSSSQQISLHFLISLTEAYILNVDIPIPILYLGINIPPTCILQVCSKATRWKYSLNMTGASEKNNILRDCPSFLPEMDKKHRKCLYCVYDNSLIILCHLKFSENKCFYSVNTGLYLVWQSSPACRLCHFTGTWNSTWTYKGGRAGKGATRDG